VSEKIDEKEAKFSKIIAQKEKDLGSAVQKCLEARMENESIKESYRELESAYYHSDQQALVLEYKHQAAGFQQKLEHMTDTHRQIVT